MDFILETPPHRIHEYIQLTALTNSHADGLFISPVIGPKKVGDFQSDLILRSYETMIKKGDLSGKKGCLGQFLHLPEILWPQRNSLHNVVSKEYGV